MTTINLDTKYRADWIETLSDTDAMFTVPHAKTGLMIPRMEAKFAEYINWNSESIMEKGTLIERLIKVINQ